MHVCVNKCEPRKMLLPFLTVSFSLPLVLSLSFPSPTAQSSPCAVTVVLVGSTGDLARRYLWSAIFHNYMQLECLPSTTGALNASSGGCGLVMVGGSRKPVPEDVRSELRELLDRVQCQSVTCELCLEKLIVSSLRVRLDVEEDYRELSTTVSDTYQRLNCTEIGRIFYLSVPPSAYGSIARHIHQHGRPGTGAWLRVVLEKPFGSDLQSAKLLAGELEEYLTEEETYRVDHYLGKSGVQQISTFRHANAAKLQFLWNAAHVEHVEVALKERLDVKGRSGFFDKYGIIRDVHQNHLTEVLLRLLVSINGSEFHGEKMQFLSDLYPPSLSRSMLGQYEEYQTHLTQDGIRNSSSFTPTYAAVSLYSRDPTWSGVPFLLVGGKQLGEREAYARIAFKWRMFSLTENVSLPCPAEIVFLIQDEVLKRPGVLLSQHFSGMDLEHGGPEWAQEDVKMDNCSYSFLSPLHVPTENAYISLVTDLLVGSKNSFVDTESLLASWQVWDPLLNEISSAGGNLTLLQYSPRDLSALDFHMEGGKLVSGVDITGSGNDVVLKSCEKNSLTVSESGFPCVVGTREQVYSCLARDLQRSALGAVVERGVFHLALPGGQSPQPLLDILSLEYVHAFPWKHTHIWQTDERCVRRNHSDSNWNQIDKLLLSHVRVPFHQLHPMPVELQNRLCASADGGCGLYESHLLDSAGGTILDHVVLGMGRDGHVASLFPPGVTTRPQPPSVSEHVQLVWLDPSATVAVKERMTLTLSTILSARAVSLLVVGAGKEEVVRAVLSGGANESDLPILRLLEGSSHGQITLYIMQ